jgi:hypothetical protein
MGKVTSEISMLVGFITGPNVNVGNGMGMVGIGFTTGGSTRNGDRGHDRG